MKKCVWFFLFSLFTLASCSFEQISPICTIRFVQAESKAIEYSADIAKKQTGEDTVLNAVTIAQVENGTTTYCSLNQGEVYLLDEISTVMLSQGLWRFSGYYKNSVTGESLKVGEIEIYVNLNTTTITIPRNIGKASVVLTYSFDHQKYSGEFLLSSFDGKIQNIALQNNTGREEIDWIPQELEAGNYTLSILLKDLLTGNQEWKDLVAFDVATNKNYEIHGSYRAVDTNAVQGVTTQTGDKDTGLQEIINKAEETGKTEINVQLDPSIAGDNNDKGLQIDGRQDGVNDNAIFEFPQDVTDFTMDLNGQRVDYLPGVNGSVFEKSDVLFHVDSGKNLNLKNTAIASSGIIGPDKNGNNTVGSVLALDGGTIRLDGILLKGCRGNKDQMPALNLIGCVDSKGSATASNGGNLNMVNSTIKSSICISSLLPPANGNGNKTPTKGTVNGDINITMDNSILEADMSAILLTGINGNISITMTNGSQIRKTSDLNLVNTTAPLINLSVTSGHTIVVTYDQSTLDKNPWLANDYPNGLI